MTVNSSFWTGKDRRENLISQEVSSVARCSFLYSGWTSPLGLPIHFLPRIKRKERNREEWSSFTYPPAYTNGPSFIIFFAEGVSYSALKHRTIPGPGHGFSRHQESDGRKPSNWGLSTTATPNQSYGIVPPPVLNLLGVRIFKIPRPTLCLGGEGTKK